MSHFHTKALYCLHDSKLRDQFITGHEIYAREAKKQMTALDNVFGGTCNRVTT